MKVRISFVALSFVLSVLIGLSLSRQAGNGEEAVASDGLLIGLSMDTLKEARWQRDRDLFTARAEALGVKVNYALNGICHGNVDPPSEGCGAAAIARS